MSPAADHRRAGSTRTASRSSCSTTPRSTPSSRRARRSMFSRAARGRGQREPASGRHRARARPRHRRSRDPHAGGREGSHRHQHRCRSCSAPSQSRPGRAMPAMGIMPAGQRAAIGEFLAFTRAQEATADAAGSHLSPRRAFSGKGMLDFFGKLQNQEYRLAIYAKDSLRPHPPAFVGTHPGARSRSFKADPAWGKPTILHSKRASSGSRPSSSATSIPSRP